MWNFLAPPAHKQELPAEKIDSAYIWGTERNVY